METRETDILEPFWEDLFDRFWSQRRSGFSTEPEGQMQAGFGCHATASEAQIARWVFRLKTEAPPGLRDPQASELFFFGTGYIFGLKAAKQISVKQQVTLLGRLHREVALPKEERRREERPAVETGSPPKEAWPKSGPRREERLVVEADGPPKEAASPKGGSPLSHADSPELLSLLFSSDPAEARFVRSRALLIQILRKKACPDWIAIREALYDPEKPDVASLQAILQTTRRFLSAEDITAIAFAVDHAQ